MNALAVYDSQYGNTDGVAVAAQPTPSSLKHCMLKGRSPRIQEPCQVGAAGRGEHQAQLGLPAHGLAGRVYQGMCSVPFGVRYM
jgi:hypothetical protein